MVNAVELDVSERSKSTEFDGQEWNHNGRVVTVCQRQVRANTSCLERVQCLTEGRDGSSMRFVRLSADRGACAGLALYGRE